MAVCKNCGNSETCTSQGEVVCSNCGAVTESNIIAEVRFQETGQGASVAVGSFVSSDECSRIYGRDSRQVTLQNGKARIQNLASHLNMSSKNVEMAFRYFKLALSKGLTKGRGANHVAAACLYIVCRTEKEPFMLLDFSDKLEVDVYTLGRTYLKITQELYIVLPVQDPCLYIGRYAHKLEFGSKTLEVCKTANRLVSRMDRDWMVQGRRPSGVCGAALLVAARIFNFNRTIKDIMKVVRIGERTIKKRLSEFEQTPSSKLTIDEFHKINLDESMDPPSYTAGLKKAELLEDNGEMPGLLEEAEQLKDEMEKELQELIQRKDRKYKKFSCGKEESDTFRSEDLTLCSVAPTLEDLDEELATYQHLLVDAPLNDGLLSRATSESSLACITNEHSSSNKEDGLVSATKSRSCSPACLEADDTEVNAMVTEELEEILRQNSGNSGFKSATSQQDRLGIMESIEEFMLQEASDDVLGGELDLEGIDDAELDELILNDEEVKIKTIRWMREHAEFLKELKVKEERKAKELLENPESAKRKRKQRVMKPRVEANTAGEVIKKIVVDGRLSDKINYNELMDFGIGTLKKNEEDAPTNSSSAVRRTQEIPCSPPEKKFRIDSNEVQTTAAPDDNEDDERYYYDKDEPVEEPTFEDIQEEYDYCESD